MAAPIVCLIRAWRSISTAGRAGAGFAPPAPSVSSRVIAPPGPVPRTVAGSTPSSAASFFARGEILTRPGAGGAGGGATGRSPSSLTMASPVPVGTVAPGWTSISSMTPLTKISTSITPLSVSTVAMMSPRFTPSPGFFRQATRVPALMSAPRMGILNSAMASEHLVNGRHDGSGLRQRGVLHVLGVRHRHLRAAHAGHRPVEVVEAALHELGADFRREAAHPPALVHDHRAVGPRGRGH